MMTASDIKQLFPNAENVEVGFKSAKGGLPESFWESFSAFANTNGGIIVLGMKEKNGQFTPDGLTADQVMAYKKNFWDCAHNKAKVSATMLTEKDLEEQLVDGQCLLVFHIPRAAYNVRPVYLTNNPFGHTFRRNHEGDYRCTDDEVRLMFADAQSLTHSFDGQILPNYTINDIDATSLRGYRQRFLLKRENHPWNELDDMAFLTKIGAYKIDRSTGDEGFTRAGVLMLGKADSIIDTACAPFYFPDYQEKLSSDPHLRWTDRIYPDGSWECNIFQFFFRVYNKLTQALPTPFMLDGIARIEETPAHIALREALVNALVHASYAEPGSIVVTRWPERITMRNPGRMLVSIEDFYSGGYSIPRNPILQKMFMLLGYGEKAGSGADTIKKGLTEVGWSIPVLSERVHPDAIEITLVKLEDGSEKTVEGPEKSNQKSSEESNQKNKSNQESDQKSDQKILEAIQSNPTITIKELQEYCGLSESGVKKIIRGLRASNLLRRIGPDKGGHWEVLAKE